MSLRCFIRGCMRQTSQQGHFHFFMGCNWQQSDNNKQRLYRGRTTRSTQDQPLPAETQGKSFPPPPPRHHQGSSAGKTCVVPALHLHLRPPFSLHLLKGRFPSDPITNGFLTGRRLPCSAEEAGASLLLRCDRTLRYTPTDPGTRG